MPTFEFPPLTMSRMTVVPSPLDGFDCAICCDPLTSRPASVLPCMHKFHTLCVNRWIATNPVCPECRNPTTFACELSFRASAVPRRPNAAPSNIPPIETRRVDNGFPKRALDVIACVCFWICLWRVIVACFSFSAIAESVPFFVVVLYAAVYHTLPVCALW